MALLLIEELYAFIVPENETGSLAPFSSRLYVPFHDQYGLANQLMQKMGPWKYFSGRFRINLALAMRSNHNSVAEGDA